MQTKIATHLLIFAVLFIYCAVVFTPRNIPIFHTEVANAALTSGIGLLGDSDTDEYRANDNRGGAFAATTLGWDEQLVKSRGLNLGAWGTWAGTRRTGYQYNWALSGATTPNMIADGQHTGLAQQVASGEVSYALIYIGANDFNIWNGTYAEVYNGTLSDAALQAKVTTIIADITLAVDTLKSAGNVGVIIANYSDPGSSVSFMQQFPNSIQRQRVTNAILSINSQIQDLAASHGAVVADVYNFGNTLLGRINPAGKIIVGGEAIDVASMGDEPHHLQLGDSHPGTVASGLLANYFVTQFNTAFNLNLAPLTDEEILINAGIHSTPTVTPVPTKSPTPAPTPVSMASVVSQYAQRKGSVQSGAISKVALDDNAYFIFNSTTSGAIRESMTDFAATGLTVVNPASASILIRAKGSATENFIVSVYNTSTKVFDQVYSGSLTTSESANTIRITTNISRYISPSGQLTFRAYATRSNASFTTSFDELRVTVVR